MKGIRYYLLCFTLLTCYGLQAQALISSLQIIEGVEVYRDVERENHYYYLPGELVLGREENGRPHFQLLQMRYTGTAVVGNQGDRGFFNLVQIGVEREAVGNEHLRKIRTALGGGTTLDPLPISSLEANLVMALGSSDGRYQRVGRSAGLGGRANEKGDWTQRYFTVHLEARESELLWKAVERGQLNFSISYAYYAEAVDDAVGEYSLQGDSTAQAELGSLLLEMTQLDSTSAPHVVRAGTVPVTLDVERWPGLSKKIDLDTGAPPAWAFLNVRCYDFANALRPDLAMKSVEIEATGVTGATVKVKPFRFMSARPAAHSRDVRFPLAVDLTYPYRYRVTDYDQEGDATRGEWVTVENWTELLDLTTPPAEIPYREYRVEMEVDTAAYRAAGVEKLSVELHYTKNGRPQREKSTWDVTKVSCLPWASLLFFADKQTPVRALVVSQVAGSPSKAVFRPLGPDAYLYLRPADLAGGTE